MKQTVASCKISQTRRNTQIVGKKYANEIFAVHTYVFITLKGLPTQFMLMALNNQNQYKLASPYIETPYWARPADGLRVTTNAGTNIVQPTGTTGFYFTVR